MTNLTIALSELAEKGADIDVLRQMGECPNFCVRGGLLDSFLLEIL